MESIETDGYLVLSPDQAPTIDHLPKGYVFMDYVYTLPGPPLFTYHRDVTSSKTVFKTKYPTYTMIQYEYEGNFLSVAPGSHARWTWGCPAGVDRMAKQYKIIHKDDLHILNHLSGTSVCKRGTTVSSFTQWWMRITSYVFVVPIQWIFLPLLHRQYIGGIFGFLQRLVPINHYNNYRGNDSKDL